MGGSEIDISEGTGGKMKNKKNGSGLFRRAKLTLSCSADWREGRKDMKW
jgi:hypothetical protein